MTHSHPDSIRSKARILRPGFLTAIGIIATVALKPADLRSDEHGRANWTYNADLIRPFWEGTVVRGESVLFIRNSESGVAKASVLFPVQKVLNVRNSAG